MELGIRNGSSYREDAMRYLRVTWNHDFPDEPVTLLSELNEKNFELRKVEIFADGHYGFADGGDNSSSTILAELPLPSFEEIASDPQFLPEWITRVEFESIWHKARLVAASTHH
jgi:hypothetical protein